MKIIKTNIDGVIIVEPTIFKDDRGYFLETYNQANLKDMGISTQFVQDNESSSKYGVIRGLHCQTGEHAQAKLVRAIQGSVLDVIVDIRDESPTFGAHVTVELSEHNQRQVFIPRGFLHGFAVLSESAIFGYKCDNYYNKESESGVHYDDVDLGIDWHIPRDKIIVSDKDLQLGSFKDVINNR